MKCKKTIDIATINRQWVEKPLISTSIIAHYKEELCSYTKSMSSWSD